MIYLVAFLLLLATPAFAVTSNFDGSENPLSEGGNWTTVTDFFDIQKTTGSIGWGGDDSATYWTGTALTADHSSALVVDNATNIGGPTCRNNGTRFYAFHAGNGSGTIRQWDSFTSNTILLTTTPTAIAQGDTVTLECLGTTTTTLRAKVNGTTVGTVQDTTSPFTTGQPGVLIQSSARTFTSWTGADITPDPVRSVTIEWTDNASTEDGFQIWRCTGTGCTDHALLDTVAVNIETYTDSVSPFPEACYKVKATLAGSAGSAFTNSWCTSTPVAVGTPFSGSSGGRGRR